MQAMQWISRLRFRKRGAVSQSALAERAGRRRSLASRVARLSLLIPGAWLRYHSARADQAMNAAAPNPAVTQLLVRWTEGDHQALEDLLPLVYDELRRLARRYLQQERPGHTLQSTALVHEAYLRLVDEKELRDWDGRGHFFAAAAEAMTMGVAPTPPMRRPRPPRRSRPRSRCRRPR